MLHTLLSMAFRPFFVVAGLAAVAMVPTWLLALSGRGPPGVDLLWHAHELVFGFLGAVFAGFFLTAVPQWTGRPHLRGFALGVLVALWGSARAIRALGVGEMVALDALFLGVLGVVIAVPIIASRSRRNLWFAPLLFTMATADVITHLAPQHAIVALRVAVLCGLAVVTIFGGRITPLFTLGALRRAGLGHVQVRERSWIDDASIVTVLVLIPLVALPVPGLLVAVVAGLGALANAARMVGWATRHTVRSPIVWILHAGYAWIPVALALWALSAWWPSAGLTTAAVHATTLGVLGTYTLGMMSRVSLGHTGRPLRAPTPMAAAYTCVLMAAVVRVVAPIVEGGSPSWAVNTSGVLWTVGFALFVAVYTPILTRPALDAA